MNILKLLPPDTRIGLKNQESLEKIISENPSAFKNALKITKQQVYRYKTGKTRLSKEQLETLSKSFGFAWKSCISGYGLEGSTHEIKLPESIEISENISWLLGFHSTESSETPHSFGVCNTEFALIEKSKKALIELGIPNKMLQLEIRYKSDEEMQEISNKHNFDLNVRFRKMDPNTLMKRPLFTLRVSSRLIKEYLKGLELNITSNYEKYGKSVQAAFLQGVYDADGWFNKEKKLVFLSQKDGKFVDMISEFMKSFDIKIRREYWKYRDFHVCVVVFGKNGENVKRFVDNIGFSHPEKATRVKESLWPA